jgi:hypothetical protein
VTTANRIRFPFALLLALMAAGCAAPPKQVYRPAAPAPAPKAVEILPSHKLPRVMLLIDEKSLGSIPTAEVEAMATSMLLDRNVPVVDQDMVRANISKGQQMLKMAGDNRGAAALGLQFGAEVIIIGEAVAKPSARRIAESNLRTYQAVATLRAVRTDNSATIAAASEDASIVGLEDVSGSSKALKAAGQKSLDRVIPGLIEAWRHSGGQAGGVSLNRITLTVGGVDQVWKIKAVREQLRAMGDKAQNVTQRSYTAGVAVFDLESSVQAEQLSETLVLKPPQGLKFQVLDVGPGKINLRAVTSK